MNTILLILTLCYSDGHCEDYKMDSFKEDEISKCDEVIIASGQRGAYPLRCEL